MRHFCLTVDIIPHFEHVCQIASIRKTEIAELPQYSLFCVYSRFRIYTVNLLLLSKIDELAAFNCEYPALSVLAVVAVCSRKVSDCVFVSVAVYVFFRRLEIGVFRLAIFLFVRRLAHCV